MCHCNKLYRMFLKTFNKSKVWVVIVCSQQQSPQSSGQYNKSQMALMEVSTQHPKFFFWILNCSVSKYKSLSLKICERMIQWLIQCSVRGESWVMRCYEGIWLVSHSDNQQSSNCNCNEILGGCNCDVTGNLTSEIPRPAPFNIPTCPHLQQRSLRCCVNCQSDPEKAI